MKRDYFEARAHFVDGIVETARQAASLLRQLGHDLSDDAIEPVRTVMETGLGRGVLVEVAVSTGDYLWPLYAGLYQVVEDKRVLVEYDINAVLFGSPATGAVRVRWIS